uniref:SNARE-associated protein Snapin-like n=1 Tax=Callithrix jacchus TaxID=9483 RepID=UPI0023DD1217|nr:SNARE-associated protein Snapin-like [Callithrix jacchus]
MGMSHASEHLSIRAFNRGHPLYPAVASARSGAQFWQCGTAPVPGGPRGRFRVSGLFMRAGAGSAAVSGAGTPVAGPTGRDLFAEGLLEFLRPAVQQLDSHVHTVRESQVELREQIDNLATELCRINEDQKVALDLDPYVKKLLNAQRRVVLVNNILQNAQDG